MYVHIICVLVLDSYVRLYYVPVHTCSGTCTSYIDVLCTMYLVPVLTEELLHTRTIMYDYHVQVLFSTCVRGATVPRRFFASIIVRRQYS